MGKYGELCNTCQFNRTYGEACMNCSYGDNYQEDTDEYIESLDNTLRRLTESLMIVEKDSNRARVLKEVFEIEKVIFNIPATVVLWKDGTKTVVKSGDYDVFDPEKGLAMAIAKKALGNKGNYYDIFKEWVPEEEEVEVLSSLDKMKQVINNITIPALKIAKYKSSDVKREIMLTPEELSEKLGITKATIQKQCREGQHPGAIKIGGKWKIPYVE